MANPHAAHFAKDSSLWIIGENGYRQNAIFILKNEEWTYITHDDLMLSDSIHSFIYEDSSSNIWLRHGSGLLKFNGTTWTKYQIPFEFNSILENDQDEFWIASRSEGLVFWDLENFTFYNTTNSGILADRCSNLQLTQDGYLWISHFIFGLSKMKIETSSTQSSPTATPPFILYPNPSSGTFSVQHEKATQRKYEVYTITGELVLSHHSDKEVWSANLHPGMYIVKVSTGKTSRVKKLFVTKD